MFKKHEDAKSIVEVMDHAGHNFRVGTAPLVLPDGSLVPDKVATIREDTGQYLGTVGKDYKVIQPVRFYELAEEFMGQTDAKVDKTLTLKGGAIMGISFSLETFEAIANDPIVINFLMMTAFNGRYSILGRAISVRWFCMNQMPSSSALFDIKHTRYAEIRLDIALEMIQYFGAERTMLKEKMKMLAKYQMSDQAAVEWFKSLMPKVRKNSKRSETMLTNNVETFVELLTSGKGTEVPGVRGTGYGALNALTEYVNHHRTTRVKEGRDHDEVKFEAVNFGSGNTLMQKGMGKLIEMVKHEPSNKYVPLTV